MVVKQITQMVKLPDLLNLCGIIKPVQNGLMMGLAE